MPQAASLCVILVQIAKLSLIISGGRSGESDKTPVCGEPSD